jgi:hypothetical protein
MMIVAAPFQFSVPDAPTSPTLEALKEYYICQGSCTPDGDRESSDGTTAPELVEDPDPQEIE